MPFFKNPEKQLARDLEAARTNVVRLTTGVADAELKADQRRREAAGLAVDGATDQTLDDAERALRAAGDRVVTLRSAQAEAETKLARLEADAAAAADRAQREATSAEVELLARELVDTSAEFTGVARRLADIAEHASRIIFEARGMQNFATIGHVEIGPAAEMVATLLRAYASGVIDGTWPAVLPKPEAPFAEPPQAPSPPTVQLFCLRAVRWTDAAGQQRLAQKFTDAELTPAAAARGLASRACVRPSDPLRRQHHGWGAGNSSLDTALDLDDDAATDEPAPVAESGKIVTIGQGYSGKARAEAIR